ncbi:MAG: class I SAM-dependent methyltransferase [Alphaproteobacteria bacterium]|nr:class I SAM-dependent methyltransferase [Alphaproteobacteria bacterium]
MTSALRALPATRFDPAPAHPQPELLAALQQLAPRGRSLDLAAGDGGSVLALAAMGLDAWGLDGDRAAVEQARLRADLEGLRATFVHGDVCDPARVGRRFDVLTDGRVFHARPPGDRQRLVLSARQSLRPGAHLVLLGVAAGVDPALPGIDEDALCDAFIDGWTEVLVRPARFFADGGQRPAWLGIFRRD